VGGEMVSWQGANKNMKSEGYPESIPESFSTSQSQILGRRIRTQAHGALSTTEAPGASPVVHKIG
jgi:hypothetical protein